MSTPIMSVDHDVKLEVVDYIVIALMLLVPLGIGVLFAVKDSKKVTRDEYLLGGRRMSTIPVTLSLFVTYMSAISLLGMPTDVYTYGIQYVLISFGFGISYILGYCTLVPLMYPLHLTSVYEYLFLRFDSQLVRMSCLTIGMLQTICYMAIALLAPALGLQAAAGIPLWVSVAIVGVIGTVYTAIGGIKSVVWTDAFQCFVMFGGVIAIIIKGILAAEGGSNAWKIAEAGGRTSFSNIDPDPRSRQTWWGTLLGGCFMWLVNSINQSSIQRISSVKTLKDAKMIYLLNIPIVIIYGVLLTITGLVIYAYFVFIRCDPYEAGFITNQNQLPPYFVLHALRDLPGMAGLYMSTLFSGALSTISSGINALAANTVEDILQRPLRNVNEKKVTLITKLLVVVYGFLIIGLAYAAKSLTGPITQLGLSIFGACGGPILGVFFLGGLIPWANKYGVLGGGSIALALNIWIALGQKLYGRKIQKLPPAPMDNCFYNSSIVTTVYGISNLTDRDNATPFISTRTVTELFETYSDTSDPYSFRFFMYDISYEWYAFIGTFVSFIMGMVISYCTRHLVKSSVDSKLIIPVVRNLWSLPEPHHIEADESNLAAIENMEISKKNIEIFKATEISLEINSGDKPLREEQTTLLNDHHISRDQSV